MKTISGFIVDRSLICCLLQSCLAYTKNLISDYVEMRYSEPYFSRIVDMPLQLIINRRFDIHVFQAAKIMMTPIKGP